MDKPTERQPVIFVVFQAKTRANGGVESITQVIERVQQIKPIIVTQLETPVNQRWKEAGAEVHVWPLPYEMGSSFRRSPLRTKWQRMQSLVWTNWRMRELVRTTGSEVVHCNDIWSMLHMAPGARSAGAAVVHNLRDIKTTDQPYGWHWKIAFQLSQRKLVLSQEMRAALMQRLSISDGDLPDQNGRTGIEYIYSIVDFNQMQPATSAKRQELRYRFGIAPETFAIGYVAAFNTKKAQLTLIEKAIPHLKTIPASRVYFIGDFEPEHNDYARACLDAVQRLALEDVIRFVGYTTEVADWYRALDLVVIASRREGLARCMIESLSCGTPVISFDVCSAQEILEGHDCGLVVQQGNYEALIEQMTYLAMNETRRQVLGQNGAKAARVLFEAERIVKKYEALYNSCID